MELVKKLPSPCAAWRGLSTPGHVLAPGTLLGPATRGSQPPGAGVLACGGAPMLPQQAGKLNITGMCDLGIGSLAVRGWKDLTDFIVWGQSLDKEMVATGDKKASLSLFSEASSVTHLVPHPCLFFPSGKRVGRTVTGKSLRSVTSFCSPVQVFFKPVQRG